MSELDNFKLTYFKSYYDQLKKAAWRANEAAINRIQCEDVDECTEINECAFNSVQGSSIINFENTLQLFEWRL